MKRILMLTVFLMFTGCGTLGKKSNSPLTYGKENYKRLEGKDPFRLLEKQIEKLVKPKENDNGKNITDSTNICFIHNRNNINS